MDILGNQKKIKIKKYLPHCKPMLMVDIISEISHEQVKTSFLIDAADVFVQDNRFQEAGLIENAAQTCSAIVGQTYFFDEDQKEIKDANLLGFISSIKNLKIHQLPKVGDTIVTEAKLTSKFNTPAYSICTMTVVTFLGTITLLNAEINLLLQKAVT
ncbi:ABC transporter permease [Flavobacterium sp. HSC-61S13]|uniref:ABC transporter permease n=1 Tax=Flavobacterium sp. HSC-61S13 TaxID=2910963 RepID=UPI0035327180|nr:putative hotdog family 3-hydroxylacyl-ACP dehydratase [Flavobacterium sp. HSC-61S13]